MSVGFRLVVILKNLFFHFTPKHNIIHNLYIIVCNQVYTTNTLNHYNVYICMRRYGISVFIIPLIVLIVTYSCICHEIWHSSVGDLGLRPRNVSTNSSFTHYKSSLPPKRAPLISRAKINTVKQTIAVIVMYVVCSTPFISAHLWATWDPNAHKSPFLDGKNTQKDNLF